MGGVRGILEKAPAVDGCTVYVSYAITRVWMTLWGSAGQEGGEIQPAVSVETEERVEAGGG